MMPKRIKITPCDGPMPKPKTCEYCDTPVNAPNFAYHVCTGGKEPRKPLVHGVRKVKIHAKKHPLGNSHMATLPNGVRVRVYN